MDAGCKKVLIFKITYVYLKIVVVLGLTLKRGPTTSFVIKTIFFDLSSAHWDDTR